MSAKAVKIIYWILTIIFCLFMLMDGAAGLVREATGRGVMAHLGMPVYVMVITGAFKIAGAFAILQNKFKTIKEWAFAGFTINFIGAFASRAFVGDDAGLLALPLIIMVITLVLYFFWKRYNQIRADLS